MMSLCVILQNADWFSWKFSYASNSNAYWAYDFVLNASKWRHCLDATTQKWTSFVLSVGHQSNACSIPTLQNTELQTLKINFSYKIPKYFGPRPTDCATLATLIVLINVIHDHTSQLIWALLSEQVRRKKWKVDWFFRHSAPPNLYPPTMDLQTEVRSLRERIHALYLAYCGVWFGLFVFAVFILCWTVYLCTTRFYTVCLCTVCFCTVYFCPVCLCCVCFVFLLFVFFSLFVFALFPT